MIAAKWGGSLLTNKSSKGPPRFRKAVARRLAREWTRGVAGRPGLIAHGAGSFGHPLVLKAGVGRRRLRGAELRRVVLEVRASVQTLQAGVVDALRDEGLPAVAVPAHEACRVQGGVLRLRPAPFLQLLDRGFLPVTGGDLAFDDQLGASVVGGDELLVRLARATGATRAVFATDVDGLLVDGHLVLDLPPRAARHVLGRIDAGQDATGGMRGKLAAAHRLQRAKVETWIVNGAKAGRFEAALGGRPAGTRLPPAGHI